MNTKMHLLAALVAATLAVPAAAGVTAEEAKALGTTLTPLGADKNASKDGTIPAWTGGLTTPPAAYKAGDGIRPNPYAGEKPRLVIDAKNMAEHADKLTEGTKALLQKYPSFRIIAAGVSSLVLGMLIGPKLIDRLRFSQHGQSNVREDTPETHKKKKGTPTMGGALILLCIAVGTVVFADLSSRVVWVALVLTRPRRSDQREP